MYGYEQDFIKRTFGQIAQMVGRLIARVLGLIEEEDLSEALRVIEQSFLDFFGLDGITLRALSAGALVDVVSEGEPDPARLMILAELFKLEGDILAREGRPEQSASRYLAALDLFLETAFQTGVTEAGAEHPHVDLLAGMLKESGLGVETRLRLLAYYEQDGQYGKAEDELLEMVDGGYADQNVLREGVEFYQRLLALDDDQLQAGEVYRDELEEGLAELSSQLD